jgi:hypothetical protein
VQFIHKIGVVMTSRVFGWTVARCRAHPFKAKPI